MLTDILQLAILLELPVAKIDSLESWLINITDKDSSINELPKQKVSVTWLGRPESLSPSGLPTQHEEFHSIGYKHGAHVITAPNSSADNMPLT